MSVRVIKDAAGVAQNKVDSLGVTGLSLPADKRAHTLGNRQGSRKPLGSDAIHQQNFFIVD